ncbi:MAG TPA: hypothetical protein VGF69_18550 [Thermoanaerobaculia bacterium]
MRSVISRVVEQVKEAMPSFGGEKIEEVIGSTSEQSGGKSNNGGGSAE